MAAAQKNELNTEFKPVDAAIETAVDAKALVSAADVIVSAASPAKQLQERLDAHFAPRSRKLSAQYVTMMVAATCLGTWVTGVALYATL